MPAAVDTARYETWWAATEHGTITFSKNCPHITAVKVVVSVQLFPGLQLSWKQST